MVCLVLFGYCFPESAGICAGSPLRAAGDRDIARPSSSTVCALHHQVGGHAAERDKIIGDHAAAADHDGAGHIADRAGTGGGVVGQDEVAGDIGEATDERAGAGEVGVAAGGVDGHRAGAADDVRVNSHTADGKSNQRVVGDVARRNRGGKLQRANVDRGEVREGLCASDGQRARANLRERAAAGNARGRGERVRVGVDERVVVGDAAR